MKIIHTADLHLGRRLAEYPLIEEQMFFLEKLVELIRDENAGALVVAGDVYDKATPQVEAVKLFDEFLVKLSGLNIPVFVISGNHDSAARLSFAGRLLEKSGIYISPAFDGSIRCIRIPDGQTDIDFYLLPFIRPSGVRMFHEDSDVKTYDDAVRYVLEKTAVDPSAVNILVAHQFVAGGVNCDSDDINIGGLDNVRSDAFDKFDYVALGHLHNAQSVGRDTVRYSGSPLKYSLSEENVRKSVSVIDIRSKDDIRVSQAYLPLMRDLKTLEGSFDEIMSRSFYEKLNRDDYFRIILTDEDRIYDAKRRLNVIYPKILSLRYKNSFFTEDAPGRQGADIRMGAVDIIKEFYYLRNGYEMSGKHEEVLRKEMDMIWRSGYETH